MGASIDYHFLSMAATRGLWIIPLILMTGLVAFRFFVFNPAVSKLNGEGGVQEIQFKMAAFSRRWITLFLAFFALMSLAALYHETYMITGKKMGEILPFVFMVIEKTHWGRIWVDRFLLMTAFGILWGTCIKRDQLPFQWLLFLLILISGTFSLIGHPADKGDLTFRALVDFVHLTAISLWIGGLFPLFNFFRMAVPWDRSEIKPLLKEVLERFSTLAVASVSIMAVTGSLEVWNSWGKVPSLALALDSNYGNILIAKVIFVFAVLAMGGLARFYILPGVRRSAISGNLSLMNQLYLFLAIEVCFATIVVVLAVLLTQSSPPFIMK